MGMKMGSSTSYKTMLQYKTLGKCFHCTLGQFTELHEGAPGGKESNIFTF